MAEILTIIEYFSGFLLSQLIFVGILLLFMDHFRAFGKVFLHFIAAKINNDETEQLPINKLKNHKRVSILIPAHNEEFGIEKTILSVLNLKHSNKEIIVIDDCSTDNTYKIAKKFADSGQITLLHRNKNGSKSRALNYASKYASGEIIVVIDADSIVTNDTCLEISEKLFERDTVEAITGCIIPSKGDDDVENILTKLQTIEYLVGMELGKKIQSLLNIILVVSGGFGIFNKNRFFATGRYDVNIIGEDMEITLKFQKFKSRIIFLPQASSDVRCPNSLKSIIRQRRRWARGQIESLWKHKDMLFSSSKKGIRLAMLDMWIIDVVLNFLWAIFWMIFIIFILTDFVYNSAHLPSFESFINSKIEGFQIFLLQLPEIIENPSAQKISIHYYYIIFSLFSVYFLSEYVIFFYTIKISGRKKYLKLFYLLPVMIVYRHFLKIVNVIGFLDAILKKKQVW